VELEFLNRYKEDVSRCVKCGGCQAACPTYEQTGDESMAARGRMALIEAVINGRLNITDGFEKRINSCLDCRRCVVSCPSGVKVDEIISAARAEIFSAKGRHAFTLSIIKRVLLSRRLYPCLLKLMNPVKRLFYDRLPDSFPLPSSFRSNGIKRLLPDFSKTALRKKLGGLHSVKNPKGRVAFFTGCAVNSAHQHVGEALIEVLNHNGIEVVVSEDELCCGIPFLSNGDRETAEIFARHNIDIFTSLGVDAVLTCCATCGSALRDYPKWVNHEKASDFASISMDVHRYLVRHTDYKTGMGEVRRSVTWHDPCHLSRGQGVKEEPREILRAIPGLEFIEMNKPCSCCGFGGSVSLRDYDMTMAIASKKAENIKNSGASELATGCPACKIHIEDALNHNKLSKPVRHTVEYLAESYGNGRK